MKNSLPSFLFAALLMLGIGGCDIAGSERIGGAPVNSPDAELDPKDPANITVYFYLDRPVAGLAYRCSGASSIPYESVTDVNGALVCPRNSVLTYFVGGVNGIRLGSVTLGMYGEVGADDLRNFVTVTPATFFGTIGDRDRNEVVNIFNLVHSLDVGGSGTQPVIHLDSNGVTIHDIVLPYAGSVRLDSSPEVFIIEASPLVQAVHDSALFDLVGGGVMLTAGAAGNAVEQAIRKTRAGIYSGTPLTMAGDTSGTRVVSFTYSMLVAHSGYAFGMASGQFVDSNFSPVRQEFDLFALEPGAFIEAGGELTSHVLVSEAGRSGAVTGRLINDRLFGLENQLISTTTAGRPPDYVYQSADVGQFLVDEPLTTTVLNDFVGDLTMYRSAESPADVDLDLLPSDATLDQSPGSILPLDYAIHLTGYSRGAISTDAQKVDPALLVDRPPLLFRIRADGDIVSDVDSDCSEVTAVGGRLFDVGGQEEFVIGQLGAVFKGEDLATYLTFALAIYTPGHPDYGFVMGAAPLLLKNELGTAVINASTGELRPKSCRPGLACDDVLEWMNDAVLSREVLKVINENDPGADDTPIYLRDDYYGKVKFGTRYCLSLPP